MKRVASTVITLAAAGFLASMVPAEAWAASPPDDRVVVMYFHRTNRCPTCQKMGSYSEEAVNSGFADQVKDGTVAFHFINFEDAKNAQLTQGYGVSGPTLIVAKIAKNKVAEYRNLKDMWTKAKDKTAFVEYVQTNVQDYRK